MNQSATTPGAIHRAIEKLLPGDVRARALMERLTQSREFGAFFRDDEASEVAKIAAKLKLIADTPAKFSKALDAANKTCWAIDKQLLENAQRAHDLRDERLAAYGHRLSLQYGMESTVGRLQMEIEAAANPLIGAAASYLRDVTLSRLSARTITNFEEGAVATGAINDAILACLVMKQQALTAVEVETRLTSIFDGLKAVLAPLELRAPRLENGAIVESND